MFEKFRRPGKEVPVRANAITTNTFTLGCEVCPNKREVCARYITKATLDPGTLPMQIATDVELTLTVGDTTHKSTERVSEILVNQASCSQPADCHYVREIDLFYKAMSADPTILNAQLGFFPDDEGSTE